MPDEPRGNVERLADEEHRITNDGQSEHRDEDDSNSEDARDRRSNGPEDEDGHAGAPNQEDELDLWSDTESDEDEPEKADGGEVLTNRQGKTDGSIKTTSKRESSKAAEVKQRIVAKRADLHHAWIVVMGLISTNKPAGAEDFLGGTTADELKHLSKTLHGIPDMSVDVQDLVDNLRDQEEAMTAVLSGYDDEQERKDKAVQQNRLNLARHEAWSESGKDHIKDMAAFDEDVEAELLERTKFKDQNERGLAAVNQI